MKNLTYKVTSIFILLLFVSAFNLNVNAEESNKHSSLIIVKVDGLNASIFNKINSGISKNADMSLEYSCLQSDVIVVKYSHSFSEKGDVQHFINNNFS